MEKAVQGAGKRNKKKNKFHKKWILTLVVMNTEFEWIFIEANIMNFSATGDGFLLATEA